MTQESEHTELCLPNVLRVVDYLTVQGWNIRKSSVYNHVREGRLRPRQDGTYSVKDVEKYARTFLKRIDSGNMPSPGLEKVYEEKLRAETEKAKAQAEHWRIKANAAAGFYIEKDAFERALAQRASVFRNDIENFIRSQAAGIIHRVAGDAEKTPDLIEYMLDQMEDWLDRYAGEKEFTVPLPVAVVISEESEDEEEEAFSEEEAKR